VIAHSRRIIGRSFLIVRGRSWSRQWSHFPAHRLLLLLGCRNLVSCLGCLHSSWQGFHPRFVPNHPNIIPDHKIIMNFPSSLHSNFPLVLHQNHQIKHGWPNPRPAIIPTHNNCILILIQFAGSFRGSCWSGFTSPILPLRGRYLLGHCGFQSHYHRSRDLTWQKRHVFADCLTSAYSCKKTSLTGSGSARLAMPSSHRLYEANQHLFSAPI
jgi:hypothetical protein